MTTPTAIAPVAPAATQVAKWYPDTGLIGEASTYAPTTTPATSISSYVPTQWNVGNDQTVQGQVNGIIAENSPLMQQAETRAKQQMNERGLMNSSMAVGAGQAALYDAALPIAQQDASTHANAGQYNANATNTASQFKAGAENTVALANQDATNRASEYGATATNALQQQSNAIRQQSAQSDADASNKLAMQDLDNQFKVAITNADIASKTQLQQLSDATKMNLINVEADYKTLIQTSASAGDIYKGTIASVSQIIQDTNMDAASKTTAINGLFNRMGVAMNLIGSINGVDVTDLLDFGTVA